MTDGPQPHVAPRWPFPEVPDGYVVGPPDFVGVGAQRCGTTRWHRLIAAHPGVEAGPKEWQHFTPLWRGSVQGRPDEEYAGRFPRRPGLLAGEWTPRYMSDFWTPPLLAQAAPDAKILVSLRDPIARYVSGLANLERKEGALVADVRNANDQALRGRYGEQLERLLEHYPREQLLVLQYERCVADPAAELARTYRFLGLDPGFVPDALHERVNAAPTTQAPSPHVERELRRLYAPDLERLAALDLGIDLDLWPTATATATAAAG